MIFLESEDVININEYLIHTHGGISGIKDNNLLESALANSQNIYFYKEADIYEIAATYAFLIIQNHAFLDGNKRTGFACMNAFLELNNIVLQFNTNNAVTKIVQIATKEITFAEVAEWLKDLPR